MSEMVGILRDYFSTKGKEKLKEKIKGLIAGGIELWLAKDVVPKYLKPYSYKIIDKNMKDLTPVGEKIAPAIIAQMILPDRYEDSVISDFIDLYGLVGMEEAIHMQVDKPFTCWATDTNTIVCKNYDDLANAVVIIDGSQLTSGTDYTVSNDTISLAKPLASGEHDLIVIDGKKKKVFSGKIYV